MGTAKYLNEDRKMRIIMYRTPGFMLYNHQVYKFHNLKIKR